VPWGVDLQAARSDVGGRLGEVVCAMAASLPATRPEFAVAPRSQSPDPALKAAGSGLRALVVDDDEGIQLVLRRILQAAGMAVDRAWSVGEARTLLAARPSDLVLLDINMPRESGHVLLGELARLAPDTIVLMVTAEEDLDQALSAMRAGAYDYIRKPFTIEAVEVAIGRALERRSLELENRAHRTKLEELVAERTGELQRALDQLGETQSAIIRMACSLAESRDGETGAHLDRMAAYCRVLVTGLPHDVREANEADQAWADALADAAPLHDIGKVGIPDSILLKPGPLTPEERALMQRHAVIGAEILATVRRRLQSERVPVLDMGIEVCAAHHERFDGTGYPAGLRGERIPLSARVAALADFYDATTAPRIYRPEALSHARACEQIGQEKGRAFDPVIVDAFLTSEMDLLQVRRELEDRSERLDAV
jgi:cyclic di-GMP phosphodiesterase